MFEPDDFILETDVPKWKISDRSGTKKDDISGLTFFLSGTPSAFESPEALRACLEEKGAHLSETLSDAVDYMVVCGAGYLADELSRAEELGVALLGENHLYRLLDVTHQIRDTVLVRYCGPGGDVTIPPGVTRIGRLAFARCESLRSVTIPSGVRRIDAKAFRGCVELKRVTLPESLEEIDDSAFEYCGLEEITIPPGTIRLGYHAFYDCLLMRAVRIPDSVRVISEYCFDFSDDMAIYISDPRRLPDSLLPCALLAFAMRGGGRADADFPAYEAYLRENGEWMADLVARNPVLLRLLCREELIPPELLDPYLDAVRKYGDAQQITLMLEYRQRDSVQERSRALERQRAADRETVFRRKLSRQGKKGIRGLVFFVAGLPVFFQGRENLKAFLTQSGAELAEMFTPNVDYVIRALLPQAKNEAIKALRAAEELEVEILSEQEVGALAEAPFLLQGTELIKYLGADANVTIPAGVTSINGQAFSHFKNLECVTIPSSVQRIGAEAFRKTEYSFSVSPGLLELFGLQSEVSYGDLVIRAPRGSYAAGWAAERGIPLEDPEG